MNAAQRLLWEWERTLGVLAYRGVRVVHLPRAALLRLRAP